MSIGHSIAVIDLLGHAESSHSDDFNYDLHVVANLIDNFIQTILIQKEGFSSVNIIAHSMGGVLAQMIASEKPKYLKKVVPEVTAVIGV
jgi:pimeloyl-ACP methyl ester carboxylesterase